MPDQIRCITKDGIVLTAKNSAVAVTRKGGYIQEVRITRKNTPPPERVALTIGVFFDGTRNNYKNTNLRKNLQTELSKQKEFSEAVSHRKSLVKGLDIFQKETKYYNNDEYDELRQTAKLIDAACNESYENEYTNVYKLYDMYAKSRGKVKRSSTQKKDVILAHQLKVYVEGVGTITGKADESISLGTGQGSSEVVAKIKRAVEEVKLALDEFFDDNPDAIIESLKFDLFGFSRGAATARYFSNIIADKAQFSRSAPHKNYQHSTRIGRIEKYNPVTEMLNESLKAHRSSGWTENKNGTVHFLGIFDTVAGMGGLKNLFDAGDAYLADVDICVRKEVVTSGLHIEAVNEYRHHFSLNEVPDFFKKITLLGTHSDIGGSYAAYANEDLYVSHVLNGGTVSHAKTGIPLSRDEINKKRKS